VDENKQTRTLDTTGIAFNTILALRMFTLGRLGCTLYKYQENMAVRHYRGLDTNSRTSKAMGYSCTWYKASPPHHAFVPQAFLGITATCLGIGYFQLQAFLISIS
jgi:hypothetical protein